MSTVDEQISELKARLGVRKDAQLAEKLGYTTGAIANWKKRGLVPDSAEVRAQLAERNQLQSLDLEKRRRELGTDAMLWGQRLAILLAPSIDAVSSRFAATSFDKISAQYADYFTEIVLACAEAVHQARQEHGGTWKSAMERLIVGDVGSVFGEITRRAAAWRERKTVVEHTSS